MSKMRKRLTAAADTQELVQITRAIRGTHRLEGFLLEVGRRWLLLHLASPDMFLNGYTAIRVADVERITPWGPDGFPAKALRHFGEAPQPPPRPIDLGSTRALLASVAAISTLVTIHVEKKDPDVCYIGTPLGTWPKSLELRKITPAAEWEAGITEWPMRRITRVEFGGRYEQALHAVGGDPPELP